jgi:hypothetical protein
MLPASQRPENDRSPCGPCYRAFRHEPQPSVNGGGPGAPQRRCSHSDSDSFGAARAGVRHRRRHPSTLARAYLDAAYLDAVNAGDALVGASDPPAKSRSIPGKGAAVIAKARDAGLGADPSTG